jgi:hypothetical protein
MSSDELRFLFARFDGVRNRQHAGARVGRSRERPGFDHDDGCYTMGMGCGQLHHGETAHAMTNGHHLTETKLLD